VGVAHLEVETRAVAETRVARVLELLKCTVAVGISRLKPEDRKKTVVSVTWTA
jgi:hypothetical protein